MNQSRMAYVYILPAALIMAALTAYPLFYGVWMAFTDFGIQHIRHQNPNFVGIQNFVDILTGAPYLSFSMWKILGFNLLWTISNITFHVILGVGLALAVNHPGIRFKKFYRMALILPWAVPTYVTALVWKNMFDEQFGAINQLLSVFGGTPVAWLQQYPHAFYAVLMTNIWLGFPFMMMVASGALQSIPSEMYEAASLDGATAWDRLISVTIPMLRPAMSPAIILGTVWTFNNFNVIYFITAGGPLGQTEILVTQAYRLVNPMGLYGVAAAFAVVIFVILALLNQAAKRWLPTE
ncbi:MAG: sugar ABC transporter permease [Candidatus Sericytochromatia bacterium]|nr:sugar ABC transporter permease [Candidatus Sericytochromatia bacterium]